MSAIWMRARSELRHGWGTVVTLGVIVGLVGGVVIAAAAAARRTESAYDRFVVATGSPNTLVGSRSAGGPSGIDIAKVRAIPQVSEAAVISHPGVDVTSERGRELFQAGANVFWAPFEHPDSRWFRPKLIAGRLPDPNRADEVVVGYKIGSRVHLGDRIVLKIERAGADRTQFPAPDTILEAVPVRVVGVGLMITGLDPTADEGLVFVTPAFQRIHGPGALAESDIAVRLRHGADDAPAFAAAVQRADPDAFIADFGGEAGRVARQTAPQTTALWLFVLLAGLFGGLIFGQALSRHTFLESAENPTLRTLGMTPRQLVGVAAVRSVVIGLLGATVAVVVAVVLSPLAPFGLARFVEPSPGLSFDGSVLGAGAVALVAVSVLLSLTSALRVSRSRGDALGAAELARAHPSVIAAAVARSSVAPSTAAGVRMAFDPERGRTATPVRATVVGVTLALAGLTLAFGFGASLHHLLGTPRLYGIDWDLNVHSWDPRNPATALAPALRRDPDIAEFSTGIASFDQSSQIVVGTGGDHRIRVTPWGLDVGDGAVNPSVIEGRWPRSEGEVALGTKTLRTVDAAVGDIVQVAGDGPSVGMRIVGRAVFPEAAPGTAGIGNGAGLTFQALRRLIPTLAAQDTLIRLAPGADLRQVLGRLHRQVGNDALVAPASGLFTGLGELRSAEALPIALGGVLALAALMSLAHTLVDSIRRRRRDLAILKTLGFVRRQVSATVAWQATTLTVVSLLVGVPLGVAAGRWGWRILAERIGVVSEPVVPLLVLLVVPATIALANLIAFAPGRVAARIRPAIVLRAE